MNECNQRFLERNGISIEDISSKIDCHLYNSAEVNPIVSNYAFYTNEEDEMISIADIVGYNTEWRSISKNIFLSMDSFFDNNGDGYHSRSIGMLEYDKDDIIENLKQSFIEESVTLAETGEGTYTILSNGLHRYTLLRILYLSEAASANGDKEKLAELRKKYTIPVKVTGVDLDKTYCKYLLQKVSARDDEYKVMDVCTEYDSNYKQTGNAVVKYANGKSESLSNELLLMLTKERILEDKTFSYNYPMLQRMYDKYPSFQMFMDEEFFSIIPMKKREKDTKGINNND